MRNGFFLYASQIVFNRLVFAEISLEAVFIQVRFETEYLLRDFLIFTLDSLQLSLALVEM